MNDSNKASSSRSSTVPIGCIVLAVVVIVALGVAGWFLYRYFEGMVEEADVLAPYENPDSALAMVRNKRPAPPDTAHLTAEWTTFYFSAIDSVGSGLMEIRSNLDSLRAMQKSGNSVPILTAIPRLVMQFEMMAPKSRRSLVNYLNATDRSWDEYRWAKTRVLAASGITAEEIDSAFRGILTAALGEGEHARFDTMEVDVSNDTLWRRIGELRTSGSIDSAEISLVAPQRPRLLLDGLPSLMNFELGNSSFNENGEAKKGLNVRIREK